MGGRLLIPRPELPNALTQRFNSINMIKVARGKLYKRKEIKYFSYVREDEQNILPDIPAITVEQKHT